jgi:integrase/recombinase XerD
MFGNIFTRRKTLSEAVEEYLVARSTNLSQHTIRDYSLTFSRMLAYFPGNPSIVSLSHREAQKFLATIPGSKKNKLNAFTALGSLWTWCLGEEYVEKHIIRRLEKPNPDQKVIEPFTKAEFERLCKAASSTGKKRLRIRNTAVVLLLLDTGIRASELCDLKLEDMKGSTFKVFGKGSKERTLPASQDTMQAIQTYLGSRKNVRKSDHLFLSNKETGTPFTRHSLSNTVLRLGERGNVYNANPHKFRHTFAINYLMNGGDIYTLQDILGHTTLKMVKRYLKIAEQDLVRVHAKASPVANWHLAELIITQN